MDNFGNNWRRAQAFRMSFPLVQKVLFLMAQLTFFRHVGHYTGCTLPFGCSLCKQTYINIIVVCFYARSPNITGPDGQLKVRAIFNRFWTINPNKASLNQQSPLSPTPYRLMKEGYPPPQSIRM